MRTWRIRAWSAIVVLVVVVAACGDDDEDESTATFCGLARQADAAGDALNAAFASGDPAAVERVFAESMEDFEAAADAAPDAISDVADEVTETAQELRDRFEELDWDPDVALVDEEALEIAARGEEANAELDRYLERECGIPADTEPEPTDPAEPAGTAAPGDIGEDVAAGAGEAVGLADLTDDQEICIGETLIATLGPARTEELSADGFTSTTPEEDDLVAAAIEDCVEPIQISATFAEQFETLGLSEEQAKCMADSLLADLGLDGLIAVSRSGEFDPSTPEGEAFVDALDECDIDPAVLAGE
jgi:hypothetical protein